MGIKNRVKISSFVHHTPAYLEIFSLSLQIPDMVGQYCWVWVVLVLTAATMSIKSFLKSIAAQSCVCVGGGLGVILPHRCPLHKVLHKKFPI